MAILDRPPERGARSRALERLRMALPELRPAERRVAEHILRHPEQAITLAISEFALECDVSQPTLSRLCRSLGFPSYAALRLGIANDFAALRPLHEQEPLTTRVVALDIITPFERLRDTADLLPAAMALRRASRVEIWPAPDFAHSGAVLADRLAALGLPTACATLPANWALRAGALPAGAVLVLLALTPDAAMAQAGLAAARRQAGVCLLWCGTGSVGTAAQQADWLVPLPEGTPVDLAGLALVEALVGAVQAVSHVPGPSGSASPWRTWPHTRSIFLPTDADPIPAILLAHEDPPQPRPLIIYFRGLGHVKEEALPGVGDGLGCPMLVASLLNSGYHVLVVEIRAHGARKRAWEDPVALLRAGLQGDGDDLLAGARADAKALMDGALALGVTGVDEPVLVIGTSWGGLQALLTLSGDPRFAGAAGLLPVTHIAQLPEFADLAEAPRVVAGQLGPWMGLYLAPRPLLLVIGEEDTKADSYHAQQFLEGIRPSYAAAGAQDHLELVLLPHTSHSWDTRLLVPVLAWLGRILPPRAPAAASLATGETQSVLHYMPVSQGGR